MSLRQLAEQLGLSQTTVSRALNGYPEVSERTRRRVQAVAEQTGYAPNPRARSLATGRAMAVGHVIPAASQHEIMNPVFADFIAGAGAIYQAAGYDLVLTLVPDDDEEATYRALAARGRVDGVIVQTPRPDDARITTLQELGLPFVVHGRTPGCADGYSWVDMDNARAFGRATRHLLELGHRRIALLNGPTDLGFAIRRRAGVSDALAEVGLSLDPGLVASGQMTEAFGYQAILHMLNQPRPPTAVLCSSLLIASGVRRAAADRQLVLGQGLSVVAHDDGLSYLPNGLVDAPLYTATRAPVGEAGKSAARMLLRLVDEPGCGPLQELVEAPLILGPSTGRAPL